MRFSRDAGDEPPVERSPLGRSGTDIIVRRDAVEQRGVERAERRIHGDEFILRKKLVLLRLFLHGLILFGVFIAAGFIRTGLAARHGRRGGGRGGRFGWLRRLRRRLSGFGRRLCGLCRRLCRFNRGLHRLDRRSGRAAGSPVIGEGRRREQAQQHYQRQNER